MTTKIYVQFAASMPNWIDVQPSLQYPVVDPSSNVPIPSGTIKPLSTEFQESTIKNLNSLLQNTDSEIVLLQPWEPIPAGEQSISIFAIQTGQQFSARTLWETSNTNNRAIVFNVSSDYNSMRQGYLNEYEQLHEGLHALLLKTHSDYASFENTHDYTSSDGSLMYYPITTENNRDYILGQPVAIGPTLRDIISLQDIYGAKPGVSVITTSYINQGIVTTQSFQAVDGRPASVARNPR